MHPFNEPKNLAQISALGSCKSIAVQSVSLSRQASIAKNISSIQHTNNITIYRAAVIAGIIWADSFITGDSSTSRICPFSTANLAESNINGMANM